MTNRKKFDPRLALKQGNITPAQKRHIKEYAKLYAEEMVDLLYEIAHNETNYARDRIQAIDSLLNRAYGKPTDSKYQPDTPHLNTIDVQKLSTPELMQMLAQAQVVEGQQALLDSPAIIKDDSDK